ncbi:MULTISPECIES: aminodeoxychorismate/anthranilate synthase component II [Listeria]|uniref:anthranilate synthase component II n=1 Tax=Listeria TaxID=1637 RepID=UPI000B5981AD|nr:MULTISPECIES: aminodeoxychorismate/anthranilate synthase component II [Listeria]
MLLIIDHHDSFTYNLYQYFLELNADMNVVFSENLPLLTQLDDYEGVILSPGPGKPTDYPETLAFIERYFDKKPILGICLGHQMLGTFFGARVVSAPEIVHGKTSAMTHNESQLFRNLPRTFDVARYHSLAVTGVLAPLIETAWTQDGVLMAMEHGTLPIYSVQFHPEAILSEHGHHILKNFLEVAYGKSVAF